jgi:hypothetical protein
MLRLSLLALVPLAASFAPAADDDGFTPLFNGRDLTGWVNVNGAPGTFFVKGGEIVTIGKPTGFLRTERPYENFVAEFEWMHVNTKEPGNSGFFVWADPLPAVGSPFTRGVEVQVLVNLEREGYYTSHGDVFSIHGATCKPDRPHPQGWARCLPSERRAKGGGEWNRYRVEANDGTIKLHVNGKEVSGVSAVRPRKGYLALESEGAECHFRNLKIKEFPSTNPKPEETAATAEGFINLFFGDLTGWKAGDEQKAHWQPRDWVLRSDGKGGSLWSEKEYGDAELIVDYRLTDKQASCVLAVRGEKGGRVTMTPDQKLTVAARDRMEMGPVGKPVGQWNRLRVRLMGDRLGVNVHGVEGHATMSGVPDRGVIGLCAEGGAVEFANIFVRELGK